MTFMPRLANLPLRTSGWKNLVSETTMQDWSEYLDRILTMSGEQLLIGNGSVSHKQAIDKATGEYRKYKARTLSEVERNYLDSIKLLDQKTDKK